MLPKPHPAIFHGESDADDPSRDIADLVFEVLEYLTQRHVLGGND